MGARHAQYRHFRADPRFFRDRYQEHCRRCPWLLQRRAFGAQERHGAATTISRGDAALIATVTPLALTTRPSAKRRRESAAPTPLALKGRAVLVLPPSRIHRGAD